MNSEQTTLSSVHKKPKKTSNNAKRRNRIRYAAHHGIEVKSDATLAQDLRQERDNLVKKVELLTAEDKRVRKECVDVNSITRKKKDAFKAALVCWQNHDWDDFKRGPSIIAENAFSGYKTYFLFHKINNIHEKHVWATKKKFYCNNVFADTE